MNQARLGLAPSQTEDELTAFSSTGAEEVFVRREFSTFLAQRVADEGFEPSAPFDEGLMINTTELATSLEVERMAERYNRLRSRRIVKLSLSLAELLKPLYRLVRSGATARARNRLVRLGATARARISR